MKPLSRRELRRILAEHRGAMLRRIIEETDILGDVYSTLYPTDSLFAEIRELERDCPGALLADPDSEEYQSWERRRDAIVSAARKRVC